MNTKQDWFSCVGMLVASPRLHEFNEATRNFAYTARLLAPMYEVPLYFSEMGLNLAFSADQFGKGSAA